MFRGNYYYYNDGVQHIYNPHDVINRVETVYYSKKYLENMKRYGDNITVNFIERNGDMDGWYSVRNMVTGEWFEVGYSHSFDLNDKHHKIISINGTRSVHQKNDVCMKLLRQCSAICTNQHKQRISNTLADTASWNIKGKKR